VATVPDWFIEVCKKYDIVVEDKPARVTAKIDKLSIATILKSSSKQLLVFNHGTIEGTKKMRNWNNYPYVDITEDDAEKLSNCILAQLLVL